MRGAGGSTLIELVLASAILLAVLASVSVLLHQGLAHTPVLEEATDLHQRGRVAAEKLSSDLRAAAAGDRVAPLSERFAALVPRLPAEPLTAAAPDVLTIRYVPPHGASTTLAAELVPGAAAAEIDPAGCPANTTACGFAAGSRAIVSHEDGHWNLLSVDAIGPGVLTITDLSGPRPIAYPAGARISEALEITYTRDAPARTLRRTQGTTSFPLVDHLLELRFAFFDGALAPLPLSALTDGPFRGGGSTGFDVDLLRVRQVRASLRLETGEDRLRGTDPRLFARPGTATGARALPDLVITIDVGVRNPGR